MELFYHCSECRREIPNGGICLCHIAQPAPSISLDYYIDLQTKFISYSSPLSGGVPTKEELEYAKKVADIILEFNGVKVEQL